MAEPDRADGPSGIIITNHPIKMNNTENTKRTVPDYKAETVDLLKRLRSEGFKLKGYNDGQEYFSLESRTDLEAIADDLMDTDEVFLFVNTFMRPNITNTISLIYGNDHGELVADHTLRGTDGPRLDKLTTEFADAWEGRAS